MIIIDSHKAAKDIIGLYRGKLNRKEIQDILYRSVNTAMTYGRKESEIAVKQQYNVGTRFQRNTVKIKRATKQWPQAELNVRKARLPLIAFTPVLWTDGVSVEVTKGKRSVIAGSFFGRMKSGHEGIFARGRYKSGGFDFRTKRIRKYPENDLSISELTTMGYSKMYLNSIEQVYRTRINNRFSEVLTKNISKSLKKKKL